MTRTRLVRNGQALVAAVTLLALSGAGTATARDVSEAANDGDAATISTLVETQPLPGVTGRGAAFLLAQGDGGDVGGALFWTTDGATDDSGRTSVRIIAEVEGRGLLEGAGGPRVVIEIFGYLTDPSGTVVGQLAEGVTVADDGLAESLRAGGLKFVGEIRAPAGAYSLRLAVRVRESGRHFFAGADVELPGSDFGGRFLLPPKVVDRSGAWVIASQPGLDPTRADAEAPGVEGLPAALPIWRSQQPLEMVVGRSEATGGETITVRVFDRNGAQVAEPELSLVGDAVSSGGLVVQRAAVAASALPAGEYRMTLEVGDSALDQRVSRSLPVLISDTPDVSTWTDPEAPRAPRPRPKTSPTEVPTASDAASATAPGSELTVPATGVNDSLCRDPASGPGSQPMEGETRAGPRGIRVEPLQGVDARGAALLFSGQNGGEVEGATLWSAVDVDAETSRATIVVMAEVDGRGLLAGSRYLPVPIEIYGYLIDESGTVVGHLSEGLLIDDCGLVRAIRETGLKFVGELGAPAGLFSLRIIVRNRETRRFFLARRDLDVGDNLSSRPVLLPPLAAEPESRWVVAGRHGTDPEALLEKMPGLDSWPAALPAWRSNERLKLVIGIAGRDARPRVSAHLVDPSGLPMPDPELTIGEEVATAGAVVFRRATVAGADVPPGPYRLQLVLGDADSGETISQYLPVVIYEGAERLAWTDPAAPRGSRPEPLPSPVETGVIDDAPEEALSAAYTDALKLWSRGEVIDARRRLAGLERPPAGGDVSDHWRRIFTAERRTILALAADHPASLVGVAMLHGDMYGWYLARRDTDLAEHSWQMAAMIARKARSIEGWQPPPGFSECLLLDLATKLAATGDWRSTKIALEAAADAAPGSAAPQLGLGALYERTGNPAAAADAFQKLVHDHPEDLEGRLRLSVNRRRLGADKAAENLLRGLLEPSAPRWITTLAYQELGGLFVAEGRVGEAVELLREGVRRLPDNQRLRILELRALDLAGRSQEADSVVKTLEARISQQSTSPRYRYSKWPDLDGDRVRSTLEAAEAEGTAALKEALP